MDAPSTDRSRELRVTALVEGFYPAPIAVPFARARERAHVDATQAYAELARAVLRYPALLALRLAIEADPEKIALMRTHLARPVSDGEWLQLLRTALEPLDVEDRARVLGSAAAGEREFSRSALHESMARVVELRNRVVKRDEAGLFDELRQVLHGVLLEASGWRLHRLLAPMRSFSSARGSTRYEARLYRGHSTPFPTLSLHSDAALSTGHVYFAYAEDARLIELSPLFAECADTSGEKRSLTMAAGSERRGWIAVTAGSDAPIAPEELEHWRRDLDDAADGVTRFGGWIAPRRLMFENDTLAASRRLDAGDVVAERWRVVQFLAAGGSADVYEVVDVDDSARRAALKMLPLELARFAEPLRRFRDEIRNARKLDAPGLVRYLDHGEDRGDWFLVSELADGWAVEGADEPARDLRQWLRTRQERGLGAPDEADVRAIAMDVCEALHALHGAGVLHRDLKPANVLLFSDGGRARAKLADFGLSRASGGERLTLTGGWVGTPEYMAPEACEAGAAPKTSAEIYSVGVMLYELLAGDVPFRADSPLRTQMLHRTRKPAALEPLAPHASKRLCSLVMRCLAKDPAKRPPSARALYDALTRLDDEHADELDAHEPLGLGPGFRLGPYQLIAELERHADRELFHARHATTHDEFALAVLAPALEADHGARRMALHRLSVARGVTHASLAPIAEVGEEDGYTWFASTLDRDRSEHDAAPETAAHAASAAAELAAALTALWSAGIAHGAVGSESIRWNAATSRAMLDPIALRPSARASAEGDAQDLVQWLDATLERMPRASGAEHADRKWLRTRALAAAGHPAELATRLAHARDVLQSSLLHGPAQPFERLQHALHRRRRAAVLLAAMLVLGVLATWQFQRAVARAGDALHERLKQAAASGGEAAVASELAKAGALPSSSRQHAAWLCALAIVRGDEDAGDRLRRGGNALDDLAHSTANLLAQAGIGTRRNWIFADSVVDALQELNELPRGSEWTVASLEGGDAADLSKWLLARTLAHRAFSLGESTEEIVIDLGQAVSRRFERSLSMDVDLSRRIEACAWSVVLLHVWTLWFQAERLEGAHRLDVLRAAVSTATEGLTWRNDFKYDVEVLRAYALDELSKVDPEVLASAREALAHCAAKETLERALEVLRADRRRHDLEVEDTDRQEYENYRVNCERRLEESLNRRR